MRKVTLFIAVSVDGYIADRNHSVDWIKGQDENVELQDTYTPFIQSIDTIIMGKRTYDQIVNTLSPNEWPYQNQTTYVLTHSLDTQNTSNICFTMSDPATLISQLKQTKGKNIWICGGADVVNQLLCIDLIDTFYLTTVPILLGGGIRLFDSSHNIRNLHLERTTNYNGIIESVYSRKHLSQ